MREVNNKKTGKVIYHKRKLSQESADLIRERFLEGDSINSLCKRYDVQRRSIKLILSGATYNPLGQWDNVLQNKNISKLF